MVDITGWPTDAGAGAVSTEARWRAMARLWAPSAVVDGYLGALAPSYAGGNVTVQAGGAWVDGHYCEQLTSNSVTVAATGLVVIRFTPADNRFQLLWVNGATVPTQTTGTWELPIAKMTGSVMTDQRVFVTAGSVTTGMIGVGAVTTSRLEDEAVTTAKILDGAVTAGKMSGGSVSSFIETGGNVADLALTLTGSYQQTANVLFTKPVSWSTYELTVWGAAAVASDAVAASPSVLGVRASVGANNGTERAALVGGGFYLEVSARAKFAALAGSTQACSIDVLRSGGPAAVVQAAHVSYLAIRTT